MLLLTAAIFLASPDPCACETWACSSDSFQLYLAQYPNHGFLQGTMQGSAFDAAAQFKMNDVYLSCSPAQDGDGVVTQCGTVAEDIGGDFIIEVRRGDGINTPWVYARAETYEQTIAEAVACEHVWRDAGELPEPGLTPQVIYPDEMNDPVCDHPYLATWPPAGRG